MENGLTLTSKGMVSLMTDHPLGDIIKPLSHEILLFDTYVAGTSYVKDQSVFDDLKDDDKLTLKREPDNRFDDKAILVLDGTGRKLGYVPERDNIVFTRLMDAGKYLIAKVKDVEPSGAFVRVNIGIYLVDF